MKPQQPALWLKEMTHHPVLSPEGWRWSVSPRTSAPGKWLLEPPFMVHFMYGTRIKTVNPSIYILPSISNTHAAFLSVDGGYQLDPGLLRRPQSHWALPRCPGSWGKPSLSLHGCMRKYLTWTWPWTSDTHKRCQQELSLFLGMPQGESKPRQAGGLEPSWRRCCSFLLGLRNLPGSGAGTRPMDVESRPAELCQVHSWTRGATVSHLFWYCFSPNFKYHFALDS